MNVLDLFSGIGGFSLGLERAGFQTSAFCEIDPFCRQVLARHWPNVPIHDDIRKLNGNQYAGAVDLVCGGYPCQPFSTAGRRDGQDDPRHLWPEMRRIIRDVRPRWVLAENVSGHIRLGFDDVAAQLEADGFTVWPFVIPASAVNAPHRRDRVWIVAHSMRGGGGAKFRQQQEERASLPGSGRPGAMADADGKGLPQPEPTPIFPEGRRVEGRTIAQCGWWETEPEVGRVVDGFPGRVDRLKALGNAVVPQVVELIGRTILAYEQQLGLAA